MGMAGGGDRLAGLDETNKNLEKTYVLSTKDRGVTRLTAVGEISEYSVVLPIQLRGIQR